MIRYQIKKFGTYTEDKINDLLYKLSCLDAFELLDFEYKANNSYKQYGSGFVVYKYEDGDNDE